jgi:hypothetical protein
VTHVLFTSDTVTLHGALDGCGAKFKKKSEEQLVASVTEEEQEGEKQCLLGETIVEDEEEGEGNQIWSAKSKNFNLEGNLEEKKTREMMINAGPEKTREAVQTSISPSKKKKKSQTVSNNNNDNQIELEYSQHQQQESNKKKKKRKKKKECPSNQNHDVKDEISITANNVTSTLPLCSDTKNDEVISDDVGSDDVRANDVTTNDVTLSNSKKKKKKKKLSGDSEGIPQLILEEKEKGKKEKRKEEKERGNKEKGEKEEDDETLMDLMLNELDEDFLPPPKKKRKL